MDECGTITHVESVTKSCERMVGFNARNISDIGEQYKCSICTLILREPVQLECGHRQCKSCVESKRKGEIIKCPVCQESTHQKYVLLDKGFKIDMRTLLIMCSLCQWNGTFKDYEDHLQKSHQNPSCEFCDERFESLNELEFHKLNECNKVSEPCLLKNYGCACSFLRSEKGEHYMSEQHQKAIIAFICGDGRKFTIDQYEGGSEMDVSTSSQTTTAQLQKVCETINILAGGIQTLKEDSQRLSNESIQLQNATEVLTNDFTALKLSVQEQSAYFDGIKPNQEILQQDVSSLKQKVEDLQFISYDGTLTWKIPSFNEKMADAQSERQTSIYSAPFYSSPTGYKMRARLYLHGDGNARRTHMSLFFVLMRSEYDPILKFPFNYKVTFCLYDQTPAQRHIIDSFRPDIKSNSFQRPRSEMNIASGIPKFFPLAMIYQEENPYVRDDTMFIKTFVDFGDMPKTLLPFALGLNPGLPANVQQVLIKQEAEKRAQQQPQQQQVFGDDLSREVDEPEKLKSSKEATDQQ